MDRDEQIDKLNELVGKWLEGNPVRWRRGAIETIQFLLSEVESLQRDKAALIEVLETQLRVTYDGSIPDEWDGSTGGGGHKQCRVLAYDILLKMKG